MSRDFMEFGQPSSSSIYSRQVFCNRLENVATASNKRGEIAKSSGHHRCPRLRRRRRMLVVRLATHGSACRMIETIRSNIVHHAPAEIQQAILHNGQLCSKSMVQEDKDRRLFNSIRQAAHQLIVPHAASYAGCGLGSRSRSLTPTGPRPSSSSCPSGASKSSFSC